MAATPRDRSALIAEINALATQITNDKSVPQGTKVNTAGMVEGASKGVWEEGGTGTQYVSDGQGGLRLVNMPTLPKENNSTVAGFLGDGVLTDAERRQIGNLIELSGPSARVLYDTMNAFDPSGSLAKSFGNVPGAETAALGYDPVDIQNYLTAVAPAYELPNGQIPEKYKSVENYMRAAVDDGTRIMSQYVPADQLKNITDKQKLAAAELYYQRVDGRTGNGLTQGDLDFILNTSNDWMGLLYSPTRQAIKGVQGSYASPFGQSPGGSSTGGSAFDNAVSGGTTSGGVTSGGMTSGGVTSGGTTSGGLISNAITSGSPNSGNVPAANSSDMANAFAVVYGPDGAMYSSPAAARAAGVTNFSYTKPLMPTNASGNSAPSVGLIAGADTLTGIPTTNTGNINPGYSSMNPQLFNVGAPKIRLPGGVNNPFAV